MIVGSRIKDARIKLGLSQEQLGNLIGVSKVSICNYEQGTRIPTLDTFVELTKVLEVDFDYLLGYDTKVISDSKTKYVVKVRKEELSLLDELRKNPELYNALIDDPVRTIKLINMKLYR